MTVECDGCGTGGRMTEKELKRLRRAELLEMLLEQTKEAEELKKELSESKKQLKSREIKLEKAGSIAEAALQVNGVFEAAQEAAAQYLENIQTFMERQEAACARREEESGQKAGRMLEEAKKQKDQIQSECEQMEEQTRRQCEELAERTRQQCEELIQQTKQQCEELKETTNAQVEARWKEIANRLDVFCEAHEELKELLSFQERT